MTTPKRPETFEDLPESDRTVEAVRITWPTPTSLLDSVEAVEHLRDARRSLRIAYQHLYGHIQVVEGPAVFSVHVPASDDHLQTWLQIRQQQWDAEHKEAEGRIETTTYADEAEGIRRFVAASVMGDIVEQVRKAAQA